MRLFISRAGTNSAERENYRAVLRALHRTRVQLGPSQVVGVPM